MTFISYDHTGDILSHTNPYLIVVPIMYRDKDKFWEHLDHKGLSRYYLFRLDGPAEIYGDAHRTGFTRFQRDWSYKNVECTDKVSHWCSRHNYDIDDLSEEELIIMWTEIQ